MAKNVIKAGHTIYTMVHRRREPAAELEALGAVVLDTPRAIAEAADVVVTIVPADRELVAVVEGPDGLAAGLTTGKALVEMTTATSATMERVAREIEATGAVVIDAPVSGGTPKAASGELTIIVGADASVLERYRPLLATMGTTIFHVGPVGTGKVVKMVNQIMSAVHMAVIGEAMTLGRKAGADPATVARVIRESSGYSRMMDLRLEEFLLAGSFEPGFKLDLMLKDVNLAIDSAQELGVPMSVSSATAQLFTAASATGHGNDDFAAVGRYIAESAGVEL